MENWYQTSLPLKHPPEPTLGEQRPGVKGPFVPSPTGMARAHSSFGAPGTGAVNDTV